LETAEAAAEAARAEAELRDAETALENMERGATAAEAHELDSQLAKTRAERDEAARQLGVSERLVKAGATPRIEAEQARERLRKAEQDLAYLEQRRARRYSAADLETARGRTKQARAALDLARQRLAAATVIAPADGVVYSLPVRRGHFVQRGDLLARVGNLDRMRVRVYVDEPELGRLAKDQEVAVTWDAQPGASWKGRVERLPSEVQALGTRNVGLVECTIANDGRLLPNINVNVEIITQRTEAALTAPKEAVFTEPGAAGKPEQRYVYVVEGGRLQRRNVATGASTPSRIEIRSGLEESQVVVVPLEQKLAAGLRVRFRAEEP
jgi:RND family efflux transporter MFP subunit